MGGRLKQKDDYFKLEFPFSALTILTELHFFVFEQLVGLFAEDVSATFPDLFNNEAKRLFVEKTISLLKKFSKLDELIINSCYELKKTSATNADAFVN